MKRLHLTFFPAELEYDLESAELGDLSVDFCHASFPGDEEEDRFWLEDFRIEGYPMKQWVINHNYEPLLELVRKEVDHTERFDGETILVGGGRYKTHIVFGSPAASFETFAFNTQRELDCFMEGIEAMDGWHEFRLAEDVTEENLEDLENENEVDFELLQKHLNTLK